MILPFPSRFLKKLEIYQQIKSGQGIAKYKELWPYESAFLQYSYESGHQHLNSFINSYNFKKWIQKIISESKIPNDLSYNRIIGNLFWRGFIEIEEKKNKSTASKLISRNDLAIPNDELANKYRFRITQLGHDVGEAISEINNKSWLIAYFNKYKYSITLDLFWLFIFLAGASLLHVTDDIVIIFNKCCFFSGSLVKIIVILLFVFILWPLFFRILRWVKQKIEKTQQN